jgi:hypothetical protein
MQNIPRLADYLLFNYSAPVPFYQVFLTRLPELMSSARWNLVGLSGFEPLTPALSAQCSNRLSYRPASAL